MTGLQEATYIVALVYMGVSLIIIFGILTALLVIRKKVISVEKMVKEKVDMVTSLPSKVAEVVETVQSIRHKGK